MVNPAIVGRTYSPQEPYVVGREKIREFARAVFSASPLTVDVRAAQAAGYPDVVAPPTFAVLISQRAEYELLEDGEAGIDFEHLVHGDQRFEHVRPIVAGDILAAELTVESAKVLGPMTLLATTTKIRDARDPDRALVTTVRAGFVIRTIAESTAA